MSAFWFSVGLSISPEAPTCVRLLFTRVKYKMKNFCDSVWVGHFAYTGLHLF